MFNATNTSGAVAGGFPVTITNFKDYPAKKEIWKEVVMTRKLFALCGAVGVVHPFIIEARHQRDSLFHSSSLEPIRIGKIAGKHTVSSSPFAPTKRTMHW